MPAAQESRVLTLVSIGSAVDSSCILVSQVFFSRTYYGVLLVDTMYFSPSPHSRDELCREGSPIEPCALPVTLVAKEAWTLKTKSDKASDSLALTRRPETDTANSVGQLQMTLLGNSFFLIFGLRFR
ncbi:hypothetical protein BJX64DRAFT_144031 [Aspergillus heterothallicus]